MSDVGFAAPTRIPQRNGEAVSYGNDEGLYAVFYMERVHLTFESEKQGKPVYEDRPYIHIVTSSKSDIRRPVRHVAQFGQPPDPERFPRQWQAFQNKQEQAQTGTPLEEWPPLPRGMVEEFKACRIHTVEQLGTVHDGMANNMPLEWRKWRDKAVQWLEQARSNAPLSALQQENAALKGEMDLIKQQLAALQREPVREENKRGPGRPPRPAPEPTPTPEGRV